MSKILKRSSFGLLRTNPKLTTNVKIIADSKNQVFLESFDADPLLSKSIYKGYNVTGGSYSQDIKRFYSQGSGILPKSIAYKVFEQDSSQEIKDRYKDQYDFTYCMGMESKNSRIYQEEFSLFFPLWVEPENIPDYFLIFKIDNPVTINYNDPAYYVGLTGTDTDLDSSSVLESYVSGATSFFENYIKPAKIIKTFDLSDRTAIGQYIRNHASDILFPESSIYASIDKGQLTYWNGISYDEGGFCKKGQDIYTDFVLVDKTITENDDFLTLGFYENGVVHPNILNLEFLFDDINQEDYKFSRYFGLYVSEAELGKFEIDGSRLYKDKDSEKTQIPTPQKDIFAYSNNIQDQYQSNENGIKIYPKLGSTSIYKGRLITWEETKNPRLPYVKDAEGNFYSINATNNWISTYPSTGSTSYTEDTFLRLKDKTINWKNFSGFDKPFSFIPSLVTDMRGRPNFSFNVINKPSNGDQIRIFYTDWNSDAQKDLIDYYTITASDDITIAPGENRGSLFSTEGTDSQVAKAIAKAINYIEIVTGEQQIFSAISLGDKVIVFCKVDSENWNKIKYSLFSRATEFPWSKPYEFQEIDPNKSYLPSPISVSNLIQGNYFEYHFTGGNDNPDTRFIINTEDYVDIHDSTDPIYIKTKTGYDLAGEYSLYLDEPVYDNLGRIISFNNVNKYLVYQLTNKSNQVSFTSSKNIGLYKTRKNSNGYLSIYPIRDFDFDFFDTTYAKDADSDYQKIYDFYTGSTAYGATATFDYDSLGSTSQGYFNEILSSGSSFAIAGGFQKLNGQIDDILDVNEYVVNEYDRLKENTLQELALSSRVVPFINKWVYDNESVDVRENPYRLNTDQSFGYSNFSPSFDEIQRNPKFFTHEWYYLQKYPPYMSFEEKVNSFSYFDEDLNFPDIPVQGSIGSTAAYLGLTGSTGNLLSTADDYFLSYFTRETVGGSAISRDFKYSTFANGTEFLYPETFFRGSKVIIKDRSEFSSINYNIQSLRFLSNPKYNTYKFSSVLTYGQAGTQLSVIKNDKWKSITLVIQSELNDPIFMEYNNGPEITKFIDRSNLYTLQHKLELDLGGTSLSYTNTNLSGEIYKWSWDNTINKWRVYMRQNANGIIPNLLSEISLNENGSYNNIKVSNDDTGIFIEFRSITEPSSNSFICDQISPDKLPQLNNTEDDDLEIKPDRSALKTTPSSWSSSFSIMPDAILAITSTPKCVGGGYDYYTNLFSTISFASIVNQINEGNPEVKYVTINEDDSIEFNTFVLEIAKPDYPVKSTYIKYIPLQQKPSILQNVKGTVGYELTALDRIIINQMARYRGNYNPKWRNVLKFVDTDEIKSYSDINGNSLDYNNVQILTDIDYLQDNNLFLLNDAYYNKVNVESPNIILRSTKDKSNSVYPLVGEIAIDHKDIFLFKSNWDTGYFTKNLKSDLTKSIIGTREPREKKSFFGSKIVAIPASLRLETFPQGIIPKDELGPPSRIRAVPQNLVSSQSKKGTNDFLNIDVFTVLALEDYLVDDGFSTEFYKYINPNYSFGSVKLDDDIKTYIAENITERYIIKDIILWEKFWPASSPLTQIEYNLTDSEKISAGYKQTKNFQTKFENPNDLNFRLIYNIPKDRNYSIAFTVILEKK
jgi:hypothetical protein